MNHLPMTGCNHGPRISAGVLCITRQWAKEDPTQFCTTTNPWAKPRHNYDDGFGITGDPETVKPWTLWTGDGWSTRNLTANPAPPAKLTAPIPGASNEPSEMAKG